MAADYVGDVEELKVKAIIGFDGTTVNGLRLHPDGKHIIYPLGDKVTLLDWETKKQSFLSGHTNIISAIDVSRCGKYIASGQINHIGFRALAIVWSYEHRTILTRHEVHKVRIEAVRFTRNGHYLISLGGRDCSSIVVWNLAKDRPLCGAPASKGTQGEASTLFVCNQREACFITAGEGTLTVWKIDSEAHKLLGTDVNVSKLKRNIISVAVDIRDEIMYCGTTTGDLLKVRLNYHHDPEVLEPTSPPIMCGCYGKIPKKGSEKLELYAGGIRSILILEKDSLLIGGGDGQIDKVEEAPYTATGIKNLKMPSTPQLLVRLSTNVFNMVTSLVRKDENLILAGTVACEIFSICLRTLEKKIILTCHTSIIYDVAFPYQYSEVFATASKNDVRVWNIESMQELLRIKVENFCCSGVVFAHDGKAIITAWNDGIIRSFTPLTGRLIFEILNAHNKGVSAIAITQNDKIIVSGGCEGQVRMWDITPTYQSLICTLKEHKGPISAIHINKFNDEAVSASTDGTCIIWDLIRHCRKQILFANTLFMCVRYHPTAVQIMTCGSDRKVAYWEVFDGSMIREIEGARSAGLNALDISADGEIFCTGGNDQMIKLWKYQQGVTTYVGLGHSAVITAIAFSPNSKKIISCSASGSIFVWNCPYETTLEPEESKIKEQPEIKSQSKTKPKAKAKAKEAVKPKETEKGKPKPKAKEKKTEKSKVGDAYPEEHVCDLGSARQEELLRTCPCKKK